MEDLMHLREYTRELKKRLPKEYFDPTPSRLLWVIPHLALAISGIAAVVVLPLHAALQGLIAVVIGLSLSSLGFLGHEILHGTVVRNPRLRDFLGAICFAQFNLGPKLWRKWHNVDHHGNTQHEHEDPDSMGTLSDYFERPALRLFYAIAPWMRSLLTFLSFTFWFSVHSFQMLLRYSREFGPRDRAVLIGQFLGPALVWVALLAWMGPAKFVFAYVIPVMIANFVVMSYIATNHLLNPLTPVNDPLANSLTVTAPRWVDLLHLNFSHHTEHHIFPSMNPKYAPHVKALTKKLWPDRYNEMPHWKALLTIWRTPRLYREHTMLVDPVRQLEYPSLGNGLNPDDVRATVWRSTDTDDEGASV